MSSLAFTKMHGLGNDFVVLDARALGLNLAAASVRAIADRHTGIGCDQLIVLEPPRSAGADVFMRILNADGSESGACGNATRCIASLVMAERAGAGRLVVETVAGSLQCQALPDGRITVDMGRAGLDWRDIPLAEPYDTLHVPIGAGEVADAVCTGMGNPHATFFVADANAVDLGRIGPVLEHHPIFPERANIGVAEILGPARLRLRVWERGVGLTLACGSAACAAVVAASRRRLIGREAEIVLPLGSLDMVWREDGHVLMTGPVATSFSGLVDPALLPATA